MKAKSAKPETAAKAKPAAKKAAQPVVKKPAAKKAEPKAAPAEPKVRFEVPMAKLKEMAKDLRIKGAYKMDRAEMIHAIQVEEGHAACYARIPDCGQMDCLFRPDCLPEMGVII